MYRRLSPQCHTKYKGPDPCCHPDTHSLTHRIHKLVEMSLSAYHPGQGASIIQRRDDSPGSSLHAITGASLINPWVWRYLCYVRSIHGCFVCAKLSVCLSRAQPAFLYRKRSAVTQCWLPALSVSATAGAFHSLKRAGCGCARTSVCQSRVVLILERSRYTAHLSY